jgi:hypothetical protein
MCRLAHGGCSQCEGADTKGGDAMGIVMGREWCLYLVTSCVCVCLRVVFVFDYELYLCLLTDFGKDRLRPVRPVFYRS